MHRCTTPNAAPEGNGVWEQQVKEVGVGWLTAASVLGLDKPAQGKAGPMHSLQHHVRGTVNGAHGVRRECLQHSSKPDVRRVQAAGTVLLSIH